jgi:hypothetical protein
VITNRIEKAAESGGVKTNRIKKAVELLKMPPSEALKELRAIQQAQIHRSAEQHGTAVKSNRKATDDRNNQQARNVRAQDLLAAQAGVEATRLGNISTRITHAVNRIDTIVNPRKWAQLPCFAGETPVWTVDGVKRIDELQPGEKVWAFDEELQQTVQRQILKVLQNRTVHFYDVRVGNSTIQATGNHPFWVEDRSEWIAARNLKAGMKLKHLNGQIIPIESINLREGLHSNTYNLSIDKNHNYFVGAGVLVHNENIVNYDLGGENQQIYIGKNFSKYPNKIYVGITKQTLTERFSRHISEAREQIEIIEDIPEAKRTDPQKANLEFYKFKLSIPFLEAQAQGIKTEHMAQYLEENLVQFLQQQGLQVMNRERGRRAAATMDQYAREIANDPDVQKKGYCK